MSFDGAVILVQGWLHQEDGGDAAGHLLHTANLWNRSPNGQLFETLQCVWVSAEKENQSSGLRIGLSARLFPLLQSSLVALRAPANGRLAPRWSRFA